MRVKRVSYELFESDLSSLNETSEWHEIDREIVLEFEDGNHMYFSWCGEPVQYSICSKNNRFFKNEPENIMDVTNWEMWRKLVGEEIRLAYHDSCHQVLEIKGQSTSVYLSSQENGSWQADVLHISKEKPIYNC